MQEIRFKYSEEDNHQIQIKKEGRWEKGQKVGALHLAQVSLRGGYIQGHVVNSPVAFYTTFLRYEPVKKVFTRGGLPVESVPALTVQGKKLLA